MKKQTQNRRRHQLPHQLPHQLRHQHGTVFWTSLALLLVFVGDGIARASSASTPITRSAGVAQVSVGQPPVSVVDVSSTSTTSTSTTNTTIAVTIPIISGGTSSTIATATSAVPTTSQTTTSVPTPPSTALPVPVPSETTLVLSNTTTSNTTTSNTTTSNTTASSTMPIPESNPPVTVAGAAPTTTSPKTKTVSTTVVPSTPEQLTESVRAALADSSAKNLSVMMSGPTGKTLVEISADIPRVPASTQKIFIAGAVLSVAGPSFRYRTEARSTTPIDATGAIDELVIVASGDPSFGTAQLAELASGLSQAGVRSIRRGLTVDSSRFDSQRRFAQWKPSFTPGEVGVLDAFSVDGNKRADRETMNDPAIANLKRLRTALVAKGILVGLGERRSTAPSGVAITGVTSPPVSELVRTMLKRSDNTYAELMTKELGARVTQQSGTTASGVASIASYLAALGVTPPPMQVDGSGLSSLNRSTARGQSEFLRRVTGTPYGPVLRDSLPVACVDGTLKGRLCSATTKNRLVAKTGSIDFVVGLTGYAQTARGTTVSFSFLLNDVRSTSRARASIDRALVVLASSNL